MICAGEGAGAIANIRNGSSDKSNICTMPADRGAAPKARNDAAAPALRSHRTETTRQICVFIRRGLKCDLPVCSRRQSQYGGFHSSPVSIRPSSLISYRHSA